MGPRLAPGAARAHATLYGMATLSNPERAKIRAAWPELLAAIAGLGNVGDACKAAGVHRGALYAYMMEDQAARREWEIAREQSADECAEKVLDIANNPDTDATRARVRMDAYRWLAAKRNPRQYSDKAQLDVNVRTVDLTRIIEAANARLAAAQAPRVIEGEVMRAALPAELEKIL